MLDGFLGRIIFSTACLLLVVLEGNTQESLLSLRPPEPQYEFRAAWITPIGGAGLREWPSKPGLPIEEQKAELTALLDRVKEIGLNTVIMHVRVAADALYPTQHAPWSAYLTGVSGQHPGYDPLAFAIEEAHQRGLHLHAWFNPFRAMLPNTNGPVAATHITRTHPEWVKKYGSQVWIDPGEPFARNEIIAAILDVVKRYDLDGVHIDDYFYPYREARNGKIIPFPDERSWLRQGVARGLTDRDEWRRNNVNDFVQTLYNAVKQEKPWVVVGISPFGIWRPGNPSGITGLDAYHELYADSRKWLQRGWADYYVPQLYWPIGSAQPRFSQLHRWWQEPEQNPMQRHVWPGLATMHWGKADWGDTEIVNQINLIRSTSNSRGAPPGHAHFRLSFLNRGDSSAGRTLMETVYGDEALVPAFPWLSDATPASPLVEAPAHLLHVPRHIAVYPGDTVQVRWWYIQQMDNNGTWTSRVIASDGRYVTYFIMPGLNTQAVAIRAINKAGVASEPAIVGW